MVGAIGDLRVESLRELQPAILGQASDHAAFVMREMQLAARRDVNVVGDVLREAPERETLTFVAEQFVGLGDADEVKDGLALHPVGKHDRCFLRFGEAEKLRPAVRKPRLGVSVHNPGEHRQVANLGSYRRDTVEQVVSNALHGCAQSKKVETFRLFCAE